ncbi:hypothetical protein BCR33DRAFT_224579 [Rhizoclosmatium globosum]|uniref:Uncharacterized protein n=1 Tax=Rhizoclosmatium globosum TaxID=329046 RepID=A0A1Y2CBV8_9FUNG|nr:hypothetical protein BCR33DRAFT_224579 [Rhizoclosmatium globosum]|eukprot:ORY44518.1 hypothetical protein BCR33DRAFT_224579 [Rhizoclosmatium globosum]
MPSLSTALGAATRLKLLQKPGRGTLNEADFVAFVRLAEDALRSPSNSASGSSQAHRDPIRASKSSSQIVICFHLCGLLSMHLAQQINLIGSIVCFLGSLNTFFDQVAH